MKISTILHSPTRAIAVVGVAGLLFAAGGSAFGSEGAHSVTRHSKQDVPKPAASAADADTLWHYLDTLDPGARAQAIIALNPNVRRGDRGHRRQQHRNDSAGWVTSA